MEPEREVKRKGRALYIAGAVLTIIYVALQAAYAFSEWDHLLEMKPDGYADFLAGVFSPLAFMWLVLGFFQQGVELRNSGEALWLQGEELRASVEQSKQLVSVTRDQLEHERQLVTREEEEKNRKNLPALRLRQGSSSHSAGEHHTFEMHLTNVGAECTDLTISVEPPVASSSGLGELHLLKRGEPHRIALRFDEPDIRATLISVDYFDAAGRAGQTQFSLAFDRSENSLSLRVATLVV